MSEHAFDTVFRTPLGRMGLALEADAVSGLVWVGDDVRLEKPASGVAHDYVEQIQAYFESAQQYPVLPLRLKGTRFQQTVWNALREIPTGEVVTYGWLAAHLGSGSRAIGQACRSNRITLLVPCHRVVAWNHSGGYMGRNARLDIKEWLLRHEGAV